MVNIKRYTPDLFETWNKFITGSRNGFFMFDRNYMEYHADRFQDHSLLIYNDEELLAVLPGSEQEGVLTSHGGLTYGGFITHPRATASFILQVFQAIRDYLASQKIKALVYKAIPYIFHGIPAQEDLYALFRNNAVLFRRDISSVIDLAEKPAFTKGTKYNISKARKSGLEVRESSDYRTFMAIEEELLKTRYNTRPTHTTEEIVKLAGLFPQNIRLFLVYKNDDCLGGTILYLAPRVVHTQYIGITDEGKEVGALDMLMSTLLGIFAGTHKYFSFGISTEQAGNYLNEGLIRNKESFGARAITNDFYRMDI